MDRDADRPRLVCDGACDRLPDPPRRVCRELVALAIVELLDRADETDVPLLDQVEEAHAAADVLLRNGHDETKVRLGQVVAGGGLPLAWGYGVRAARAACPARARW